MRATLSTISLLICLLSLSAIAPVDVTVDQPGTVLDGQMLGRVYVTAPDVTITECVITGGVQWFGSGTGRLAGNTIFNSDSHGIYTHNNRGGTREIANNRVYSRPDKYALQVYSEKNNALRDYHIHDNEFHGSVVVGGGLGLYNLRYERNTQHGGVTYIGAYDDAPVMNSMVSENIFIPYLNGWISGPETSGNQFFGVAK